jgi:hypothetical protein
LHLAKDGATVPLAVDDGRCRGAGKGPWVAEASGFNVHASVTVRAADGEAERARGESRRDADEGVCEDEADKTDDAS